MVQFHPGRLKSTEVISSAFDFGSVAKLVAATVPRLGVQETGNSYRVQYGSTKHGPACRVGVGSIPTSPIC